MKLPSLIILFILTACNINPVKVKTAFIVKNDINGIYLNNYKQDYTNATGLFSASMTIHNTTDTAVSQYLINAKLQTLDNQEIISIDNIKCTEIHQHDSVIIRFSAILADTELPAKVTVSVSK